mmetsp:Transcript_19204/g.53029  ORF Transcript_19204/g.53029 Transcript_19204/m.53029 type:complete len:208 (+) Transcript_19204:481-1104(+)
MLERDGGRVAAAHLLGGGADVRHGGGEGGDELDEHVVEVGEGEVATIELGQLDGVHGHAVGLVVLACPALAAALGNEAVEGLAAVEVGASDHDHVARGHLVPQFLLQQRPGHLPRTARGDGRSSARGVDIGAVCTQQERRRTRDGRSSARERAPHSARWDLKSARGRRAGPRRRLGLMVAALGRCPSFGLKPFPCVRLPWLIAGLGT